MERRFSVKLFFIFLILLAGNISCKAAEKTDWVSNSSASTISPSVEKSKAEIRQANIALRLAVEGNNSVATQAAIERGARLEEKDDVGWTPLHQAAWDGYVQVMDVLIKAGANIEAKSVGRNTPLHLAAWQGQNEAIKRLVQAGAVLNGIGSLHQTPLEKAIYYSHQSTADLLRSLGAQQ